MILASGLPSTLSIGDAYYPAWLACIASGVVGAMILRAILIKKGWDQSFRPRPLAYPSLAVLIALVVWLLVFRS